MSPREVLFLINLTSMLLICALTWAVIFAPISVKRMRRDVLVGLLFLFALRLGSLIYATAALGPAWRA